jgi:class 3 adenylate cyclase
MDPLKSVFGPRVAGTRVVPIVTKIVVLFTVFLLASNFATNYINLVLNRGELQRLANRLLVKDLADIYGFASNQYEIYKFSGDLGEAVRALQQSSAKDLTGLHSTAFGIRRDGAFLFWSSKEPEPGTFDDRTALAVLSSPKDRPEGKLSFVLGGASYFGVYKYIEKWDAFLVRAEEINEFQKDTDAIFARVALIILVMTVICVVVGGLLVRRILRFVGRITQSIMRMQSDQKLALVDLEGAPNDDVSYLGASFNSLSSSIDNLMTIFKRFVTQDIALRAYKERSVKLEGTTRELTILFSDIKGFTFMTETLGNDIIDVLNLHYQRAIGRIHEQRGIVGSIIGDALLAVFGTIEGSENKSLDALNAAYLIQDVAAELRRNLSSWREELVRKRGALTEAEDRVYRAVLLEVGVGIDGGDVFYGNIGSYERMANTVIGDNVNSASRLEGLTRIYHVPVVCSEFVMNDITASEGAAAYRFLEMDKVQVKGKTEGKRIFWPIRAQYMDESMEAEFKAFSSGLQAYYAGDWAIAASAWKKVTLPLADVFRDRISAGKAPEDWNGIWAMTTK